MAYIVDWSSGNDIKINNNVDKNTMLSLVDAGLAVDYSYMADFNNQDVAKAIATEMEANAGSHMMIKMVGTGIGALAAGATSMGVGASVGAGIGSIMATVGIDAYEWIKNKGKDPGKFWNDYAKNLVEASRETGMGDFVEELNKATQLSGGAKTETQKTGWGTAGYLAGVIIRDTSGMLLGGVPGIIGANMIFDGSEKAHAEIGAGKSLGIALKNGMMSGLATGISASLFMGAIPKLNNVVASKFFSGSKGTAFNVLSSGAEFAGWGATHSALENMFNGKPVTYDPFSLGGSFAAGMLLSKWIKGKGSKVSEALDPSPDIMNIKRKVVPKHHRARLYNLARNEKKGNLIPTPWNDDILPTQSISDLIDTVSFKLSDPKFAGTKVDDVIMDTLAEKGSKFFNDHNISLIRESAKVRFPNAEIKIKTHSETLDDLSNFITLGNVGENIMESERKLSSIKNIVKSNNESIIKLKQERNHLEEAIYNATKELKSNSQGRLGSKLTRTEKLDNIIQLKRSLESVKKIIAEKGDELKGAESKLFDAQVKANLVNDQDFLSDINKISNYKDDLMLEMKARPNMRYKYIKKLKEISSLTESGAMTSEDGRKAIAEMMAKFTTN